MKTKLRVGVIGAGSVVREIYQHLYFHSEYSDLLKVTAVADPNEESRNWLGGLAGVPPVHRFARYHDMLSQVPLDAVQVNTPDHLHCEPTVAALNAGLDVVVPKPAAATVKDAHAMIQTAKKSGRFLGIDFHKREDPRIKEAAARFQSGRYGKFQAAVFYMLDKLLVADPNRQPRYFASPDFAEQNTPVSFLTVHMADALMHITREKPVEARATGYAHKLPSLQPTPVAGYDLVDTEVRFASGALAHFLTGWALPDSAWSTTVQSGRLICSEGLIDLGLDTPGLREIHSEGVLEVNPLFRNFEPDGKVTGYGITSPGRLYQQILMLRNGELSPDRLTSALDALTLDFYTTLVLEGAETSLEQGKVLRGGVTAGAVVDLRELAARELGPGPAREYGMS
ncbi:MAG TPA: Gfo/Idh/MocA family oxidoreductase [Verrucomicrobiae bacterium]